MDVQSAARIAGLATSEPLVERDDVLAALRQLLAAAAGQGRIALVAGEAGIGKTSVLRALSQALEPDRVWWGACDALQTPHPLAPLRDIARTSKPRLRAALAGPRPSLFEAFLDEMRLVAGPLLVVFEDVHWADDATLDLLKYLGRRIDGARALLAVTYRDDEITASHPLRRVLGELPTASVTRIELAPLSPQAVQRLAQRASCSAEGVHEATRGNPFFVVEALRDRGKEVPRSVQDLVLARQARLPASAQQLLRLTSVVPGRVERSLVEKLLSPGTADLEACLGCGLIVSEGTSLAFRHELARKAVEGSIEPSIAQSLHAQILRELIASGCDEPARLVHHATHALDRNAVSATAPIAAEHARQRGAHREAAAHWRTALREGAPADEPQRQRWLEAYALECQLTDQLDEAIAARQLLDASYRRSGQRLREADNLSRSALLHVLALRNARADSDTRRAIELFDGLPACGEQAYAYWVQAQLRMLNRECDDSIGWSRRAVELAEQVGHRETAVAALGTLGAAMLFVDYEQGVAHLERALANALDEGLHWIAANSLTNLGSGSGELFKLQPARRWLCEAIQFSGEHEIDFWRHYATAWLALCELQLGNWSAAGGHANDACMQSGATTTSRVMALVALGRLRARRGDPGADTVLDSALALAESTGTLQRIGPVRAARAESALMRGDCVRADAEAAAALPLAQQRQHAWLTGELAMWRWRAGGIAAAPAGCATPYALEIAGRWREAANEWQRLGCPYDAARALADGDADAQRESLAVFEKLGAQPAADIVRARLRKAGVRGIARGARRSTLEHPCGLTTAEMKVLQLMADDLRNVEIASRLHRSVRTVDHHVAAVLAKLGVATRTEAVKRALHEGWVPKSG